ADGVALALLGGRVIREDGGADLVEAGGGNLVAGERGLAEAAAGGGDARSWVVDGVLGAVGGVEERGEIAVVHGGRGHGVAGVVMAGAGVVNALVAEQEERLVLAVVDV